MNIKVRLFVVIIGLCWVLVPKNLFNEVEISGNPVLEYYSTPPVPLCNLETLGFFTCPDLFNNNQVLAYYGHPLSKYMGIVGRHSKEELVKRLKKTADKYDKINGEKGVVPAIYLIYGTVQPKGEINIMSHGMVKSYIEFALKHNIIVYVDHQIGKYTLEQALDTILPFLKYPNVHLAFDLEWRTTRPMREIGHIKGEELNRVQEYIRNYMIKNSIPGKRQLVFHQFNHRMVRNVSSIKADYEPVLLVHTTSGWGPPGHKLGTHKMNSKNKNIPYKGFKLWYHYSDKPGIHYDRPLMSPAEVLSLTPEPQLIIYQ